MNPRHETPHRPGDGARRQGAVPFPPDPVLEEVSRKATQLERRTRALEAENTKLRREHTKAVLAAAQAQDALKEFHATDRDEPRAYDDPPAPPSAAAASPVRNPAAMPDRRQRPIDPIHRADDRLPGTRDSSALGSLTVAACLIAMTVNYAILLRYFLGDWLAGFSWAAF